MPSMLSNHLITLSRAYEAKTGWSHWQVGLASTGSAKFYRDLRDGDPKTGRRVGCSIRTYERALRWFSDHWPADLAWPADVPRPPKSHTEDAA